MSGADLPAPPRLQRPGATAPGGRPRLMSTVARRPAPSARTIARRRFLVWLTKWSLPVLALALLGSIALWPEIARVKDQSRVAFRRVFSLEAESGRMVGPRYHGIDERGRPYTVTADSALQTGPERIVLTEPKGDMTTEAGSWLMGQAKEGVYIQRESLMDLSKDVVLYREDGTVLQTDTAALDLKAGAGTSSDKTHAEGPFGTLDAQGFILTEKGAVIQFQGPAHLVLNSTDRK
jgi:lipopolysaccharide export system protein LptC